jgi:hypothetical protein
MTVAGAGAGSWGAPVAGVMRPTADGCNSLTQASNSLRWCPVSKKFFHAGHEP